MMSQEQRNEISKKHYSVPSAGGGTIVLNRCLYDGEPWPCDTVKLLAEVPPASSSLVTLSTDVLLSLRLEHYQRRHSTHGIYCAACEEEWPCRTYRLVELARSALNFTVVWQEVLPYAPDDSGFTMQCVEAEAAADLFRAFGDGKTADLILDSHSVYDTEEESHYDRGQQVISRRGAEELRRRERKFHSS